MSTLYQSTNHWNQYLIRSARARWWDYGKNGVYYVTMCTKQRFPFFGTIQQGQLQLSVLGAAAKELWEAIPTMIAGVHLSSFIVMPNHIHAIVILDRPAGQEPLKAPLTNGGTTPLHPKADDKTVRAAFFKSISPQKGSLPHIIRKFKGLVTKLARQAGWIEKTQPLWQARYYDRVIRHPNEFFKLSQYIQNHVETWEQDDYFFPMPNRDTKFELLPPAIVTNSANTPMPPQANNTVPFKEWQLSVLKDIPSIIKAYWQYNARTLTDPLSWQAWLTDWLAHHADG